MKSQIHHRLLYLLMVLITSCEFPNLMVVDGTPHRYSLPSRNQIPDQTIFINNTLGPINFTIGDRNFNFEQLQVSAISSNKKLVDSIDIVLSGSGGNRTITITPIIGRTGETIITLIARDRRRIDSTSFMVTVLMRRENIKYPTVLFPLPQSELLKLKAEFDSLNDTKMDCTLNEYGFITTVGLLDRGQSTITDTNIVVSKAKSAVWKFRKFTNVIDTNLLIVKEIKRSPVNLFTDWWIHLKQPYKGLTIDGMEISLLVHQDVVQMYGNTYKDVFIPIRDLITIERAIKSLLGYEIEYYCWTREKFIVSIDKVLTDRVSMVIYPKKSSNKVELRVAWKIPIGYELPRWDFYIDVLTGEIVCIHQLFFC